jgi:hypothetical protein
VINDKVDATVSFTEADLSLFANFPNATVNIQNLAIINKALCRRHFDLIRQIRFKDVNKRTIQRENENHY